MQPHRLGLMPTCEAIIMLAKLITLPMPSATPSASSLPPLLRIAERASSSDEHGEERHDHQPAEREQPRGSHHRRSRPVADSR